jgi:hypothetical protein
MNSILKKQIHTNIVEADSKGARHMSSLLIWHQTSVGDVFSKEIIATPSTTVSMVKKKYNVDLVGRPLGIALRTQDHLLGYAYFYHSNDFNFNQKVSRTEQFLSTFPLVSSFYGTISPDTILYQQVAGDRAFTDPSRREDLPFDQWHSLGRMANTELARLAVRKGGKAFLDSVCTLLLPSATGSIAGGLVRNKVLSFALSAALPTPIQDQILQKLGVPEKTQ